MNPVNYLILGGGGLVGQALRKELNLRNLSYVATSRNDQNFEHAVTCNITDLAELKRIIIHYKPAVVINATNLSGGVDFSENNPDLAINFHLHANQVIADTCQEIGAVPVLISTDYVFDGNQLTYTETDTTNPLNKYGQYKLEAENYFLANCDRQLVVRTTNVYGWDPTSKTPNYLMGLLNKLSKNEPANAPSFLSGTPTLSSDLAEVIIQLCEKGVVGLFHVVGDELINRYDWTKAFCQKFNLSENLIHEIKTLPENSVPRPLKLQLSNKKVKSVIDHNFKTVAEGLDSLLKSSIQEKQ